MTAPSEVFYFLRALLSRAHVCNPPNERGGRAARRLSSDGWVTTCNLRWHKSNSRCRCQTNDLAFGKKNNGKKSCESRSARFGEIIRVCARGGCCWKNGVDFTAHYENGLLHARRAVCTKSQFSNSMRGPPHYLICNNSPRHKQRRRWQHLVCTFQKA
jgi:hypothetical protein